MTFFAKVSALETIKKYKHNSRIAIPFFFTFANAVLGLLSIVKALDSEFIAAAFCILLATFMDTLDGRLARALGCCSVLGMELDSLCDAISFCLAPAVLIYSWDHSQINGQGGTFGFIVLAVYLCAGLFRLAKFNIISPTKNNNWFSGLPVPVPAFLLAGLVLHKEWLEESLIKFLLTKNNLFGLLLLISFLMISKIKFPAFKQSKGILFYIQFIIFLMIIFLSISGSPYMIFIPLIYIIFGFVCYFYSRTKGYLISKF